MNNLVVKAYHEMKKSQIENQPIVVTPTPVEEVKEEINKIQKRSKELKDAGLYAEDRIIETKPFSKKKLQSVVSIEIIQQLQLLTINLPFYKNYNPNNLKVKALDNISQIKTYSKIHGDQVGKELKAAVSSIFSYAELKNIYNDLKLNENIGYAYAKLHEYFEEIKDHDLSLSYEVLEMLCEYMAADLNTPKTV